MSKRLRDMLTEFLICEIGSRALDGITYTLLLKTNRDKELIERYKQIKVEANNCGFVNNEVFRMYEIGNGYIFDMDIGVAKMITAEIARSINASANYSNVPSPDLISDMPEKRRKRDIIALGRYLVSQFDLNRTELEVALFSRNSTNRIVINGKSANNEPIALTYNAYAIRHWDIEILNEKILIPMGIRVSRIQSCEILPSKTGVSFQFKLEPMAKSYRR